MNTIILVVIVLVVLLVLLLVSGLRQANAATESADANVRFWKGRADEERTRCAGLADALAALKARLAKDEQEMGSLCRKAISNGKHGVLVLKRARRHTVGEALEHYQTVLVDGQGKDVRCRFTANTLKLMRESAAKNREDFES